ncbi:MAG: hypothetical protein Q7T17_04405 [Microbacterium sp.]|uniref:IS1096 element passenger TnpR family protein n=1 Tax=Microbacterium sp. TaxID=51671 RepID=UPI002719781F|nr:hypothetical protein [Microbacterium sp.]MDO8382201.1 hypothetical protein [Microbacterium sp.]
MPARPSRRILRLRASIVGIEPEIWRTIDVDDSLSLAQLHMVLQVVFNWFGSHLGDTRALTPGRPPGSRPSRRLGRVRHFR